MELIKRKYAIELVDGEGNTFTYTILDDNKTIIRQEATVQGYLYEKDRSTPTRYWKKCGRGGVKNKAVVERKLVEADSHMYDLGYYYG